MSATSVNDLWNKSKGLGSAGSQPVYLDASVD